MQILIGLVNVDDSSHDARIPVVTTTEHLAPVWTEEH